MTIKKYVCAIGLAILSLGLRAEEITLICTYDSGVEMLPLTINFKTKQVVWGQVKNMHLVGKLDRHLTIRSVDTNTTVGGVTIVVDRFGGDYFVSHVHYDDVDKKIFGGSGKGTCSRKQF